MVDELDDLSSSRISKVGWIKTGDDVKGSRMRLFIKEDGKVISREDEETTKFRAIMSRNQWLLIELSTSQLYSHSNDLYLK